MPEECSLWLEIYNDDGSDVLWGIGTQAVDTYPYLIDPMRYGEQVLDVAKGSATIATVTVGVIDPETITNDQDSGWMTARLADVYGRRCRLQRWVNGAYVVIADGRAGEPKLEPDYASYTWEIRDTRETERKVRAFYDVAPTTSVWPSGIIAGFGSIPAVAPNVGRLTGFFLGRRLDFGSYWATGLGGTPASDGTTEVDPEVVVSPEVEALFLPTVSIPSVGLWQYTYQGITIRWRETGSGDPYTVAENPYFLWNAALDPADVPLFLVRDGVLADGKPVRGVVRSATLTAFSDEWSAAFYTLALSTDIDILVTVHGPASKTNPIHIEGLTAGEFAQNAYDGLYSPRDGDGNVVPTGILYDEDALLLMTDPVSIRLTEPIPDLRDALEKKLYPPIGWAPALDSQGRISPVSQVKDAPVATIDNEITEPNPSWGAGNRIINTIVFKYQRDYKPDPTIEVTVGGDGLATREIQVGDAGLGDVFRDVASITKHGEQVLEVDGSWFRATGTGAGLAIDDDVTAETGWQLAHLRRLHLLSRYANGAPSFSVNVMRSGSSVVRVGSFVEIDLSWFPNPYVTGRRGLTGEAQVMGIAELDCAWRQMAIEMLPPPPEPIDDLAADDFSHARIDLSWTLPELATGVKLHRDNAAAFTPAPGNLIATLGAVEEYEDTAGILGGNTYYYQAVALSVAGDAAASNEASATTPATPPVPNLLTATQTEIEDADLCAGHTWTQRIAWTYSGSDDVNYQTDIHMATDLAGTNFLPLVSGLSTTNDDYDHVTGVSGNLTGSLDAATFRRRYRVLLVPRGGGTAVESLDTVQDTVTIFADPC